LKKNKAPDAELIRSEEELHILRSTNVSILIDLNLHRRENSNLIKSVWNKEKLPQQWKESTTAPIHTKDDEADYSNYTNYVQNIYWYSSLKVNFICRQIYWGSSVWILM